MKKVLLVCLKTVLARFGDNDSLRINIAPRRQVGLGSTESTVFVSALDLIELAIILIISISFWVLETHVCKMSVHLAKSTVFKLPSWGFLWVILSVG